MINLDMMLEGENEKIHLEYINKDKNELPIDEIKFLIFQIEQMVLQGLKVDIKKWIAHNNHVQALANAGVSRFKKYVEENE
jgi:hypothetical protein